MSDTTEDLEIVKSVLKTTREKLFNVTLVNIELETALVLERERVAQLEAQLKNNQSPAK